MSRSTALGPSDPTDGSGGAAAVRVQPHGLLLVVREPLLRVVQASTNAAALIGRPLDTLLLATLADLGGDLEARVRDLMTSGVPLSEPQPLRGRLGAPGHLRPFEGALQRVGSEELAIELEPPRPRWRSTASSCQPTNCSRTSAAMCRPSAAPPPWPRWPAPWPAPCAS